jgi:hypothetical protein
VAWARGPGSSCRRPRTSSGSSLGRLLKLGLILGGIAAFLGIALLTTRVLAADTRERSDIVDLLNAQAKGDPAGMLRAMEGCSAIPACRARVQANSRSLRRPGQVELLRYDPSTQWAFTGGEGQARVAWRTTRTDVPIVQCIRVRRTGNVFSGPGVELVGLSAPRAGEASCRTDG